ncbi:MAG: serine hydrolase domain-containing protein [Cyclobacterium sp.]|uniref:serine hydrolase domain-containing protein n=1 Tax=unclassified Cyclobacterium TaxID=2615055 RepID=UPI0013D45DCB|nr:serine hydrolase domain-containing protein [Cyclobacterium sp. SYSU L10401]
MISSSESNQRIFTAWQNQLKAFSKQEKLQGIILSLFREKKDPLSWTGAVGNLSIGQPYFITSVAKLHLLALILKLKVRGKVNLDDPLSQFLEEEAYQGLCIIQGQDFTPKITIRHLLSHLSGLPDYFQFSFSGGKSLREDLFSGKDQSWKSNDWLKAIKKLKPPFKPGEGRRVFYADSNFQLLGKIVQKITHQSLEEALTTFQLQPLSMNETYVYKDVYDRTPVPFYFQERALEIPLAMSSFGPVGGMVSTSKDSMTFLKAFFHGQLFPLAELDTIQDWKPMIKHLSYGLGITRFERPRYTLPFRKSPEIIGHTGLSGAFALYVPERKLFLTGTVNQSKDPYLPYKLASRIISSL